MTDLFSALRSLTGRKRWRGVRHSAQHLSDMYDMHEGVIMSNQSQCCSPSCLSFHCTRLCTVSCHLLKHFACTYL